MKPNSNTAPLRECFIEAQTEESTILYERGCRLICDDYELNFGELFHKNGSFHFDNYNMQTLCSELYKVYHNLLQTIQRFVYTKHQFL